MKKALKFLSSMRFALILLLILILACAAGSLVTQNQTLAWYTQRYSEQTAALIVAAGLDDVFHSWWFIVITAFLCINLFLCNLVRLPSLVRRFKAAADPSCIAGARAAVSLRCRGSRDDQKYEKQKHHIEPVLPEERHHYTVKTQENPLQKEKNPGPGSRHFLSLIGVRRCRNENV